MIYLQDPDFTLRLGDVREELRELPDESVHCVVTSPPYLGLRDYGTEKQIGLESSIDEYVRVMVEVFAEVRRVLRHDATCWLNLGDSYNAYNGGAGPSSKLSRTQSAARPRLASGFGLQQKSLKPKDLMMVPARVALALQDDGWYLRSEITWCKPNPMPESVTDRPTQATEKVYLLTRSPRYFFDQEAVREPAQWQRWGDQTNDKHEGSGSTASWIGAKSKEQLQGGRQARRYTAEEFKTTDERNTRFQGPNPVDGGRNLRNWWPIATEPYPDAHFATFPTELVRRCILAGTSERGCCSECGAPWMRETDVSYEKSPVHGSGSVIGRHYETGANNFDGAGMPRLNKVTETTGWRPSCDHHTHPFVQESYCEPIPCTVLDPFMGSGTTALVARKHGRNCIGIELSKSYCELAARRLQQLSLLSEGAA